MSSSNVKTTQDLFLEEYIIPQYTVASRLSGFKKELCKARKNIKSLRDPESRVQKYLAAPKHYQDIEQWDRLK